MATRQNQRTGRAASNHGKEGMTSGTIILKDDKITVRYRNQNTGRYQDVAYDSKHEAVRAVAELHGHRGEKAG